MYLRHDAGLCFTTLNGWGVAVGGGEFACFCKQDGCGGVYG